MQLPHERPAPLALLKGVWRALASGYTSTSGFEPMDQLASRGGMESMLNTIWLIVTALGFGGVVEKAGVLVRVKKAGDPQMWQQRSRREVAQRSGPPSASTAAARSRR